MTEFDTSQLLLSKRLGEVRIDPCCFFYIDNYLPDDFYQALRETFPDESTYESDDSKKRASDRPSNPIRSTPSATRTPPGGS